MITAESYFSGAGGMDMGLINAGINVTSSLELDEVACKNLRANFDHEVVQADIKDELVLARPKRDIAVGTFPCNRYSRIGDIHGVRTGDDLFLHFFRHVAIKQHDMYMIENVPGMKKFKVVMEAFTKLPDYYVNVICPVDSLNWLPQKRKRLIIIGTKKPFKIEEPKISMDRPKLKDILEENPEIEITKSMIKRMAGKYRDKPIISDPNDPNAVAPTCVAHYKKDRSTRLVKDDRSELGVRPYTPLEYARLQGFPDNYKWIGTKNDVCQMIGNAVAVPVGKYLGELANQYFAKA